MLPEKSIASLQLHGSKDIHKGRSFDQPFSWQNIDYKPLNKLLQSDYSAKSELYVSKTSNNGMLSTKQKDTRLPLSLIGRRVTFIIPKLFFFTTRCT